MNATAREVAHLHAYAHVAAQKARYQPLAPGDFMPSVQRGMAGMDPRMFGHARRHRRHRHPVADTSMDMVGTDVVDTQFGTFRFSAFGDDGYESTNVMDAITSVAGAIGTVGGATADIISAINQPTTVPAMNQQYTMPYYPGGSPAVPPVVIKKDNTMLFVGLGAAAIAVALLMQK